jgi:hypothetical protein
MVINMDDTVAVTQNFADEANLLRVKRSLLGDEREITQVPCLDFCYLTYMKQLATGL